MYFVVKTRLKFIYLYLKWNIENYNQKGATVASGSFARFFDSGSELIRYRYHLAEDHNYHLGALV